MISPSNFFARIAIAIVVAGALGACTRPDVHSPTIRGMGYIKLDDVVKHHPLYPQLKQLDDAIAAINLQAAAPHVPLSASQVAQETKELNRELHDAQERANKILQQKQQDYAAREQKAVGDALKAANVPGAGNFAASQMSSTSAQQAQAAAQAANQDFMAYQQSVISQNNAASTAIARQLQTQEAQKLRAKAEQLQQNETDLSLRLSQQDSAERLAIKTRMSNLALDEATRKQLTGQLQAINQKEAAQIEVLRNRDQAEMSAYKTQLDKETSAAIQSQVGAIQSETRSKIEARQNEVSGQIRSLGAPSLPTNLPPDVQSKIQAIHKQFTQQFQADAAKTVDEYNTTKTDLDRQFAALHGADVGATGAAAKELSALQKRRDDLNKQIVDQVQREAGRVAKDLGFTVVFTNVDAAPGGYDMSNEVIKDVESLHE